MKILNIAKAKEDIVSCYGSDCNFCSLLETISNVYNFLLGIVFALGVFYLIIIGLRVLLESGSSKAIKNLKDGFKYVLTGFGLILLGWLTIHTIFWASGYTNAGYWWQFKCDSGDSLAENNLIDSSDNLTSYTTLAEFLNSGDTTGRIQGPDYSFAFAQQLDSLDENQSIQFYTPVTSRGGGAVPQLIFTVKKDGGEVGLENTGEFWKVVQSEWVNVQKTSSFKDKGILNRVLKADTSDYILPEDKESLTPLYSSVADVALKYEQTETAETQPTTDLNTLLLVTLLYLFDKNKSSDEGNLIIALLLTEILKIFDSLTVETNTPQISNVQKSCINSGGEWVDDKCICDDESLLKNDGRCYSIEGLKLKCLESKGSWEELTNNSRLTPICSEDKITDQEIPDPQYYCNCLENSCITYKGECIPRNKDTDGDGINDDKDKCINTPEGEKVNQKEGSDNYGCSCSEIEIPQKNCPQDYCEGDYLYTFPREKQECLNGELQTYTCETKKEYSQECANRDDEGIDEIRDDFGDSSGNGSGNNNTGNGSSDSGPDSGENSSGSGENSEPLGNPEGIKAALKRIEQKDPLRYEMIFRFVSFIKPTGFPGGYCAGCGRVWANHGFPLKMLDQIIVHEATHSAHACTVGWGIGVGSGEWIAVANEIGSLYGRNKGPKDMTEFQGQSKQISYRGTEVRGYLARYMKKVNPKGDMGPGNMDNGIQYAFRYIPKRTWGNTKGPYHYGDPDKDPKVRLLGLVQQEEDVIDTIIKTIQECRKPENKGKGKCKCKSSPPPDLPPVEACKGAPVIQLK